jgi:hypothetical protein
MTADYCKMLLMGDIPTCDDCIRPKEGKCVGYSFDPDGHAANCKIFKFVFDKRYKFWHKKS